MGFFDKAPRTLTSEEIEAKKFKKEKGAEILNGFGKDVLEYWKKLATEGGLSPDDAKKKIMEIVTQKIDNWPGISAFR